MDGVLIEKLDLTKRDGTGATRPFLNVFDIQEILTQLLFSYQVRGFVVMFGQLTYGSNIHPLSSFGHPPELKILDHAFS